MHPDDSRYLSAVHPAPLTVNVTCNACHARSVQIVLRDGREVDPATWVCADSGLRCFSGRAAKRARSVALVVLVVLLGLVALVALVVLVVLLVLVLLVLVALLALVVLVVLVVRQRRGGNFC